MPAAPPLTPTPRDLVGKYWCSIDGDDEAEPRQLCVIKKVGDGLVLAKVGGMERIRGKITLDDRGGFTFVGERYLACSDSDCTQTLRGRFRPAGKGGFRGTFSETEVREGELVVELRPAPPDAVSGDPLDDEWGDPFELGGAAYGGDGDATWRFDSRGRRKR